MEIIKKIVTKQADINLGKPVTIAFLGDSITQGCFDVYIPSARPNGIETIYDYRKAYSTRLREILNILYPKVQINIINSGISGDTAMNGKTRLERDIFPFNPDLVVVSYGANDLSNGLKHIDNYLNPLREIFNELKKRGIEVIFLTQNSLCTEVSDFIKVDKFREFAKDFSEIQKNGLVDTYFSEAKKICQELDVKVCDVYSSWKKMIESGVCVTELLANKLNHPIEEMHYYTAVKLVETMMGL